MDDLPKGCFVCCGPIAEKRYAALSIARDGDFDHYHLCDDCGEALQKRVENAAAGRTLWAEASRGDPRRGVLA